MITPTIPKNELERQLKLENYNILNTENEIDFDAITEIVARLLHVPICVISMIDNERQWFKSTFGIDEKEMSRDLSFCGHAINFDDVFVVENAKNDERFFDNPMVLDGVKVRFYAGAQLSSPDGFNIGTICAIDDKPKQISEDEKRLLKIFAKNIISMLELKSQNKLLKESLNEINFRNDLIAKQLSFKEHVLVSNDKKFKDKKVDNYEIDNSKSLTTRINYVKNGVSNVFNEKNNKLIFLSQTDVNFETDEPKVEIILKYIFLAINDFFKNEIFVIKPNIEDKSANISIKNTLVVLWRSKNILSDEEFLNRIDLNENLQKAKDFIKETNFKLDFKITNQNGLEANVCF